VSDTSPASLGTPRIHHRLTDSTNERARALAARGAPHGTLVTAGAQSAGRGRQGRSWLAPPGGALLSSIVIRDPPPMLPLLAGLAVAEVVGPEAVVKWPNDVLLSSGKVAGGKVAGGKVAGILVEGRPQEGWAVLGIGVNVAVQVDQLPPELRDRAATLGLPSTAIEPLLEHLLERLGHWISTSPEAMLEALRARDALRGLPVRWAGGRGVADGIDRDGRLVVLSEGARVQLEAGEVHLE